MSLVHQINGRIIITQDGEQFYFEWQGGDVVGFSDELLDDANLVTVDGDVISIGPYRLEIVERLDDQVIAKRIDDE